MRAYVEPAFRPLLTSKIAAIDTLSNSYWELINHSMGNTKKFSFFFTSHKTNVQKVCAESGLHAILSSPAHMFWLTYKKVVDGV